MDRPDRPEKDLSIAVPSWNTKDLLAQCLDSVRKSSPDLDYELIVVDNASTDGSPGMVEELFPDARLIRNRVNMGFAAACNLAFKHSSGRYFVLLNSDTIVRDGSLRSLARFMDRHPAAGAAGCKLLNRDGTLQRSCSSFPSIETELYDALYLSKLFPRSRVFGQYSMSWWDFDQTREVDFAGGSCLIVRRKAIEEIGLLDEGFFMYTEEADWCYRLWEQGWKVYYYPGAEVVHLGGESARVYGDDIRLHLYSSRNRFILKHHGKAAAVVHKGVVGLAALCRLGVFGAALIVGRSPDGAVSYYRNLLRWAITAPVERLGAEVLS